MKMMEKLNRPAFKEYAGAIAIVLGALPALTGMIISIVSSYRGEPEAQKAYSSLAGEVNKVHDWMSAINLELAKQRGREEGTAFGQQTLILAKLEALQAENDLLKKHAVALPTPPPRGEGIGLGSPGTLGHGAGAGFGAGAGRLGGSHARKPKVVVEHDRVMADEPPPAPAAEAPPTNYQEQQPLKKLPSLDKLPASLDEL